MSVQGERFPLPHSRPQEKQEAVIEGKFAVVVWFSHWVLWCRLRGCCVCAHKCVK